MMEIIYIFSSAARTTLSIIYLSVQYILYYELYT